MSIILSEYIRKKYIQYSYIDTIAFSNMQTLFDSLYEPLTIFTSKAKEKENESFCIDSFPEKLFEEYYRIIIEDTGGMGKSTILKKIFKSTIEEKKFLPIFIYLSKINENNSIIKEIHNQLNYEQDVDINSELEKLLKDGDFVILFDGFDEISTLNRGYTISNIHDFIQKYTDNYYVISTRPEDSILSFDDFMKFNVRPLKKEEAYSIIEKYDIYNNKKISNMLIDKIGSGANRDLREYLQNPFLVSLLYKSFDYKKDIPLKKTHFYGQVFDALFEQHDLSKETYLKRDKHSGLHKDDFERILRSIGFLTLQSNSIEYERDFLLKLIDDIKSYNSEVDFKVSGYLKDLIETVPLFRRDGGYIRWAHKSLQGYFAAKYIWIDSKGEQNEILREIYKEQDNFKFIPILELFHELDPSGFESTILMWFIEDFTMYVEKRRLNLNIKDDRNVNIFAGSNFAGECYIVRTEDWIDFSALMKDFPSSVRAKAKIATSHVKVGDRAHKSVLVSYPEIKVSLIVNYKAGTNVTAIYDFIYEKYPMLREEEYIEELEDIEKIELLKHPTKYNTECNNENVLISGGLEKTIAGLLSNTYLLSYEKCTVKLQEIKNKKNKNGLYKWRFAG